jgi:hypothetical protein
MQCDTGPTHFDHEQTITGYDAMGPKKKKQEGRKQVGRGRKALKKKKGKKIGIEGRAENRVMTESGIKMARSA